MTERNDSEKLAIVWVDHDEKVSEIVNALKELKRSKGSVVGKSIGETYDFVTVIVPPGENLEERALAKITEACPRPSLVLVDLNFHREHPPEGIKVGRLLALYLRDKLRSTPVGLYTRYDISPLPDKALISTDRFAIVFDDIRQFYESPHRINADDWVDIFSSVIEKARKEVAVPPHQVQVLGGPHVEWAGGHPLQGSRSFREAAPKLASLALDNDDSSSARVTLTQLGGGFSGSYVVKAEIEGSAPLVIKVDEDITKLERELAGYRIMERRIKAERYLPLLSQGPTWPVRLYDSWWGAFAMKYAEKAKPLIEHNELDAPALAAIYQRLWADCLGQLYGDASQRTINEIEILTQEVRENANNGWGYLSHRYESKTTSLSSQRRSELAEAISFVASPPRTIVDDQPFDVPWVNQVHGDLNCRNILIDESNPENFRLIDFPNVTGGNCLAVDFVKAEAELVLIIMDWWTGRDCDFERVEAWGALTAELSSDLIPSENLPDDSEAARILPALRTIRQTYSASAATLGEPSRAYSLYLIKTVLRYVAYSDITIAKRFLALLWAGQLLLRRW